MVKAFAIVSATILSAATVAAQSSSTSSSTPKTSSFVGCLEQSQRAVTPDSGSFILNTPTPSTATAETRKGTPEDPAANARAAVPPLDAGDTGRAESKIANVYVLDGASAELSKHVGHKVEVTGILTPAADASTTSSPTTGAGMTRPVPHLKVAAVRMVAASCTGN